MRTARSSRFRGKRKANPPHPLSRKRSSEGGPRACALPLPRPDAVLTVGLPSHACTHQSAARCCLRNLPTTYAARLRRPAVGCSKTTDPRGAGRRGGDCDLASGTSVLPGHPHNLGRRTDMHKEAPTGIRATLGDGERWSDGDHY